MHNLKTFIALSLICISFNTQVKAEEEALRSNLFINQTEANQHFDDANQRQAYSRLLNNLSRDTDHKVTPFYHVIKMITKDEGIFVDGSSTITLTDFSTWDIGYFYNIKNWSAGERLKISYYSSYTGNDMKIENIDRNETVWGTLKQIPANNSKDFIQDINYEGIEYLITLNSGNQFTCTVTNDWANGDKVFIFHMGTSYQLLNLNSGLHLECTLIKCAAPEILKLEGKLNNLVLAQPEATKAVSTALMNYSAGLNDPNAPIGVFLFMGPTGTGKTELAKAIASEFYGSASSLTRFDMSHFTESHSLARLLGSPPGYVNHEEGGQLTNALKNNPQSIILLDEIEKAHGQVRKVFLPIFDEGYVKDNKNKFHSCKKAIFIMTSNICAPQIAELFNQGFEPHEILEKLEPYIMQELSPELYNRVQPVLFHPLQRDVMERLVDLMLKDVILRIKNTKGITLVIDSTAKEYLAEHGFHQTLGARPLKKLIETKVTAAVAYTLIREVIPKGSTIILSYDSEGDSWHVNF